MYPEASNTNTEPQKSSNICEFCGLVATFICADCHNHICKQCRHIYDKDHCPATNKDHFFQLITSQNKIEPKEKPNLDNSNLCEFCGLLASFTCADCHNRICKQCRHIYDKDHCPATNKDHFFQLITSQTKIEPKEKPWSCGRCTFSNPPQNKICAMCGRGVNSEFPESGSRKCAKCTYLNAEDAKICAMCSCTLPPSQVESYI